MRFRKDRKKKGQYGSLPCPILNYCLYLAKSALKNTDARQHISQALNDSLSYQESENLFLTSDIPRTGVQIPRRL